MGAQEEISTADAKAYALKCCVDGIRLNMADLKRSLPEHMHLRNWGIGSRRVHLAVQVADPREFWDWAEKHWLWSGVYDVQLIWFTGSREPNDQDSSDVQVEKRGAAVTLTDMRSMDGIDYG